MRSRSDQPPRADPVDSIWLFPLDAGEPRELFTDDHARWSGSAHPRRARHAAMRYTEGTHTGAHLVDVATGARKPALPENHRGVGSVTAGPTFSANGERMAVVWSRGERRAGAVDRTGRRRAGSQNRLGKALNEKLQRPRWSAGGATSGRSRAS
jgi:hypothetical protein